MKRKKLFQLFYLAIIIIDMMEAGRKTCYYTTTIDENGAVKWNRDKGDCDVIKFGGVKTTATSKPFTGKGTSTTTEDILTSSTAQTSEDMPSTEAVGSTNNPPGKGISTTTEDILTSSTARTSEDMPSTEAVGSTNNPPDTSIPTCPTNMIYGACSCNATCEDPKRQYGCKSGCLVTDGCTCPAGFLMQGSDCISASKCGCFVRESNLVTPNGEASVNGNCTQKCSCNNNQLTCDDYSCSTNAACDVENGVRQCYCNEGYEGDGETCESWYKDCQDVYDAGNTQDGVYSIMPTGWSGLPFNVSCKMENGGGWTVLQRRNDGSTSFDRNWAAYKEGFGDSRNLWLGNEKLHYLTNQRNYKLRFDITTSSGSAKYAEYTEFQIESESNNYKMNKLGSRSGDQGIFFEYSRGKQFSTYDRDNDACGIFNCAEKHRGGWWHSNTWCLCFPKYNCDYFQYIWLCMSGCTYENLNGVYNGNNGENIFSNGNCNLQFVEMKIRPFS